MRTPRWMLTSLVTVGMLVCGLGVVVAPASAFLGHKHLFKLAGSFNEIKGVAVGSSGVSYVSDQNTGLVQKFGASGALLGFSGSGSSSLEGLQLPQTVAADNSTGAIYVVAGFAVHVFNAAGEPQFQIAPPGGSFSEQSVDVAVNSTTHEVYVSDGPNHLVDVFNSTGEYQRQLTLGIGEAPLGVGVDDATGKAYVLTSAGSVLVFSAAGVLEATWTSGSTAGHLASPTHLAVDQTTGHVYVSLEGPTTAVDEFSASGEFLSELTSVEGVNLVSLTAIAVDPSSGNLYVANNNNQVDVFGPDVLLPDVTTGSVSSLTATSVTLTGSVNPLGLALLSCGFSDGTLITSRCSPLPAGSSPVAVSTNLVGLEPNTTYPYQLEATNANGTNFGKFGEFTTLIAKPVVVEQSASFIEPREVLLSTTVNTEHSNTTYHFVYGPTARYGSSLPVTGEVDLGSGVPDVRVVQSLTGLQPSSTYHYAVVATSPAGTTYGPDETFTTPAGAVPGVATGGLLGISPGSATVAGAVDPAGVPTTYEFDLGTDTSYGTRVFGSAGSGSEVVSVTSEFQSLSPNTAYHYRLVASNAYATTYGADETFTTGGWPTAVLPAPVTLPLLEVPQISFPTEPKPVTTKTLTRAQRLAAALKACKKQSKKKQASCEKQARKKYAPAKKK
jgi:DNA-binding beta-propeller fold protein YncE